MNKLPTKQIYLLFIIVMGIISLSVYSTYAIFTLESETSDIVNLHTPNSLQISTNIDEYKQLTIPKNSYITTDIDVYNTHEYEICYSIWYKIANSKIDKSKISVYQNTETTLEVSSTIPSMNSKRITLIIINDNDIEVKVNIGLSSSKYEDKCELNIEEDKSLVTEIVNDPKKLSEIIIKNTGSQQHESGYLTYPNIKEEIILENNIYVSENFEYDSELFKITEPIEANIIKTKKITEEGIEKDIDIDIMNYISTEEKSYYTCLEDTECVNLYKINKIEKETIKDEITNEEKDIYKITDYDKLIGYLKGESGIKENTKNNTTDYIYYGDNPNNFIYYNCINELDNKTCELWRIIGTYYNSETNEYMTKIIRNDLLPTTAYNEENNTWDDSLIKKYLNEEYKLNNDKYIKEIKYNQENIPTLETKLDELTYKITNKETKIGLLSVSDYLDTSTCKNEKISEYTDECLNNNWLNLNNNLYEWTNSIKYIEKQIEEEQEEITTENKETTEEMVDEEITDENPTEDEESEETDVNEEVIPEEIKIENNIVYSVGPTIKETLVTDTLNVRPVVYLKERILLISGNGTLETPYIIR